MKWSPWWLSRETVVCVRAVIFVLVSINHKQLFLNRVVFSWVVHLCGDIKSRIYTQRGLRSWWLLLRLIVVVVVFKEILKPSWLPEFWKKIENTQETERRLFNWTKQDKMCKILRKSSFSSYVQQKSRKTNNSTYLVSVGMGEAGGRKRVWDVFVLLKSVFLISCVFWMLLFFSHFLRLFSFFQYFISSRISCFLKRIIIVLHLLPVVALGARGLLSVGEVCHCVSLALFQCTIFKAAEEGNVELASTCLGESPSCIETKTSVRIKSL